MVDHAVMAAVVYDERESVGIGQPEGVAIDLGGRQHIAVREPVEVVVRHDLVVQVVKRVEVSVAGKNRPSANFHHMHRMPHGVGAQFVEGFDGDASQVGGEAQHVQSTAHVSGPDVACGVHLELCHRCVKAVDVVRVLPAPGHLLIDSQHVISRFHNHVAAVDAAAAHVGAALPRT